MPHSSTVVVVDDHDPGRFAKVSILRRAGFNVHEASTGREALEKVASLEPDVVILDVNLPDMNGVDVCRQLKARPSAAQVLQISATAIEEHHRIAGLSAGADSYLVEPVTPEILVATTHALLRVKRTEQKLEELAERERAARQEAEHANRAKDEFLAVLSHELRTPLNAMSGWLWQLKRSPDDVELRNRAVDGLSRGVQMQARLIDDLLDISRIEKGKIELSLRTVDLRAVVSDAVEAIGQRAAQRQLTVELPDAPVLARIDGERFTQVISNLLNNAVQYTSEGGEIRIRLANEDHHAVISVSDNGAGIPPELLPVIFDAFRQGDVGSTRHATGLGLGLAIVKRLLLLHGGQINAESAGRGRGATFTVRVPIAANDSAADATLNGDTLAGVEVLLVEDDPDARELMRAMLEAAGASVGPCASAAQALQRLETRTFTVLVSDIAMPDRDGLDLLRSIRDMGLTMPAVAVTAFSSISDRIKTSEAGYDAHLPKPVDQQALIRTVKSLTTK